MDNSRQPPPNAPSLSAAIGGNVKLYDPWLTQLRDKCESLIRDTCMFPTPTCARAVEAWL